MLRQSLYQLRLSKLLPEPVIFGIQPHQPSPYLKKRLVIIGRLRYLNLLIMPSICAFRHSKSNTMAQTGVKVNNDWLIFFIQHHIRRIDIVVAKAKRVKLLESSLDALEIAQCIREWWALTFLESNFVETPRVEFATEAAAIFLEAETSDLIVVDFAAVILGDVAMWVLSQYFASADFSQNVIIDL